MSLTIGVDIGGTKVAAAVVDEKGEILQSSRRPTPSQNADGLIQAVAECVNELRAQHDVEAIGVGTAGWISSDRSTLLYSPNMGMRDVPMRDLIAEQCKLPVFIENDANVAMWAEFRFGAAQDANTAVLYTIGTGVGGAIVVDGNMVRGTHGTAGELGHVRVVPDGRRCGCGRWGCLEQYASGDALTLHAQEAAKSNPHEAEYLLSLAGDDADQITGAMVTKAAQNDDRTALRAFNFIGRFLGNAAADMVQSLDPGVILLGGGVVDAGDFLLAPVRRYLNDGLAARRETPYGIVRAARMGQNAGVVGAADLARQDL
ncbi:ROK family protein [Haloglycomyces albus]|uniref:ROK family protein n=1 Tax=Haloglycomyces albus TaxID=526067 RepID=UPI00046D1376|nr:ROK family protein [Haloglycomyces albus]